MPMLPIFSVISDYLDDSETLVELPTLEPDVVLLPQAVAIAATIATTATKAKIFFIFKSPYSKFVSFYNAESVVRLKRIIHKFYPTVK